MLHQTKTGYEPNDSANANVSVNTANGEMDTSGERLLPKVDMTHDNDDTISHVSDIPLQLPARAFFRHTFLQWQRSHKLGATLCHMFTVLTDTKSDRSQSLASAVFCSVSSKCTKVAGSPWAPNSEWPSWCRRHGVQRRVRCCVVFSAERQGF